MKKIPFAIIMLVLLNDLYFAGFRVYLGIISPIIIILMTVLILIQKKIK